MAALAFLFVSSFCPLGMCRVISLDLGYFWNKVLLRPGADQVKNVVPALCSGHRASILALVFTPRQHQQAMVSSDQRRPRHPLGLQGRKQRGISI